MSITKLDQVIELVKTRPQKRLVAAYANDAHTIEAVHNAVKMGIVKATLVGDEIGRASCRERVFMMV